jgi:hypothetical protein
VAYQAQGVLSGLGLVPGSGASTAAARKPTPFQALFENARAEIGNRLQEALAVYRRDLQYIQVRVTGVQGAHPASKQRKRRAGATRAWTCQTHGVRYAAPSCRGARPAMHTHMHTRRRGTTSCPGT